MSESDLHPYQAFCVDFIEKHAACALFLDCGLGKTAIALTAIDHMMFDSFEVSRVLIIAPLRVARDTWPAELEKWAHLRNLRMERIIGSQKERVAALARKAELYVVNRENVEWLVKHYQGRKLPFDMLVIDELSSFKNGKAKRFMALKRVISQFSRVVGLTGTPAPNGLEDLWPQIFLLDRGVRLGRTMRSYIDMFFTTPNSWLPYKHELKPGAEKDIYKRLSDICVSMRATDHLHMPERVDNVVELTLSTKEEKLYKQMERDMLLPYADGDVLALNAATLAGKLLQLSNGAVYDEFHNIRVIHDKKLDALEDIIEAANGKPVLVMVLYKHDLVRIQERFGKWSPENENGARELKTSQDMTDWNDGKIPIAVTQ
ncbi:MAG: SNF2-related protein, partial [Clostridia bacterium]